jgi:hypothetical protein
MDQNVPSRMRVAAGALAFGFEPGSGRAGGGRAHQSVLTRWVANSRNGVLCASQRGGALGMTKGVLITLLLVGLSAPAAAAPRYPGDRGPGGIWNDGPHACRLGQSCNCHPDAYVAIRCEGTPYGPQCWWNNNCYCEPPMANQYCGSRSGSWPSFQKRPRH